jgi:hypothetical protein
MLGGAMWLLAWAHFLLTHGPTTSDNKDTFLALSYYDSTKLTVFASALCLMGLVSLRTRQPNGARARVWTWGHFLAVIALFVMAAGLAVAVWGNPWGDVTRVSTTLTDYGFIAMMIASLFAPVGLAMLGIGAARAKILPAWAVPPLAVAGLAAVPWGYHTPYGVLVGLGWLVVGFALWRPGPGPEMD